MRVTVTTSFHDKFNQKRIFWTGEVVDFEDKRAADLVDRGLATPVKADAVNTDGAEEKKVVESAAAEPLKEDKPEEKVADNSEKAKEASEKAAAKKIAKAKAMLSKEK